MKTIAWDVYRDDGRGRPLLRDTVFFDEDCDEEYVKRALINHDGYPADIIVIPSRPPKKKK